MYVLENKNLKINDQIFHLKNNLMGESESDGALEKSGFHLLERTENQT